MNKAVIIAGGKGTRMGTLSKTTPKALLKVASKPLLEYQLNLLKSYGFKQIFILTNHLGDQIEKFCGDGSRFGLSIRCLKEKIPLGTAGAVKNAEKYLTADFLVIYGDEMINVDLRRLLAFHSRQKILFRNLLGTLAVHPNDHPWDSNLVEVDNHNLIKSFLTRPHPPQLLFRNLVSTPLYILTPKIFRFIPRNTLLDFGRQIFPKIAAKRKNSLVAYSTPEYIKDVGTPQRLREVNQDVLNGKFDGMNLRRQKPAIFLDRDGVINKEVGNLRRLQDFALLPQSASAIKKINQSNYYAVVISNQPVVAKGFCTYKELLKIHKKMETLLGAEGAKLDAIYFCPHHPDKGFPGENKKYKIICNCRKPKTGMIEDALRDLNIDLPISVMIGDSTRDAKLAENLGIKFLGVKTGGGLKDNICELKQKPRIYKNLFTAVNTLTKVSPVFSQRVFVL